MIKLTITLLLITLSTSCVTHKYITCKSKWNSSSFRYHTSDIYDKKVVKGKIKSVSLITVTGKRMVISAAKEKQYKCRGKY